MTDDGIMSYFAKIGLDSSQFLSGLQTSQTGMLAWYRDITLSLSSTMFLFQQFEQIGKAAFDATVGAAINVQDQIQQFSYITGMTVEQTQKWRAAAIATNTDFNNFTSGVQYLNARLTDTGAAGEDLRKSLEGMGISVKDANGNLVDNDTLLRSIFVHLSALSTAQEKDAAGKEIFGRTWYNYAEMINKAGDAIDAYDAKKPNFTQADLDNIDEAKTEWAELSDKIYLAGANVAVYFANLSKQGNIEENYQPSYLDQWLNSTFNKSANSKFGAGARTGADTSASAQKSELTDPYSSLTAAEAKARYLNDVTIPALKAKLLDAEKTGTAADVAKASLELKEAQAEASEVENDRVSALVAAYKEYENAIKKVTDAQKTRENLTKNYAEDMIGTLSDPGQAASLTKNYRRAMESTTVDTSAVTAAATEYTKIKHGEDLSKIAGTDQYTEAQAKSSGDLIFYVGDKKAVLPGAVAPAAPKKFSEWQRTLQQAGYSP